MKFWEQPLTTLNDSQWEALCDGCGRCCMHKFEDEETGELYLSRIACRLFDDNSCRCSDYAHRFEQVELCLNIRQLDPVKYHWLPETCAYRLRFEGKPLPDWHPLLSGSAQQMHEQGISMRNRCVSECDVNEDDWPDYLLDEDV